MRMIISEEGKNAILKEILKENNYQEMSKLVNKYLDANFVRADKAEVDALGKPSKKQYVLWKDSNGQPLDQQLLTDKDLFYIAQDRFKNILGDRDERDKFLKNALINWYYGTNKW